MCGIVGYISEQNFDIKTNLEIINHRGPDSLKSVFYLYNEKNIGLGHVRLSIIDVDSHANQPFDFQDKYTLIFNGEIYNYLELREYLKEKGYIFCTNSDTEVLISAYDYFQEKVFEHLDGMFAFCIYDKVKNKIIVARDHLGIKPVYYYYDEKSNELFFASELKALFEFKSVPKKISSEAICEYLFNGWLYEPHTGFENVFKIMPGSFIEYDLKLQEKKSKIYFDVTNEDEKSKILRNKNIEELIDDSIMKQCRSDVPLGVFFSGGIDSTVIANKVNNPKCLSAKYDKIDIKNSGIGDDYIYSKKIAEILNLDIEPIKLKNEKFDLDIIKHIINSTEELNADFTYSISEKISKKARLKNYIVMLSGMGADEIFGGYPRYKVVKYKRFYKFISYLLIPFKNIIKKNKSLNKKVDRFFNSINENDFIYSYSSLIGSFSKSEIEKIIKEKNQIQKYHDKINKFLDKVKTKTDFKKAFYLDLYGFLSHNFIVADKSSMQASIEMRVPLINKELVVKNFYENENKLLDFFHTKKQLKKILYKVLPKEIINRKKTGFNPPMDNLIKDIGKDNFLKIIKSGALEKYINLEYIEILIYNHFNNLDNNTYKLWQILFLHFWILKNE
ncbi:asparagine synthase (glutamine-hydrolyzing) [Aliarcobacter butzleri]|uniref:asparagine synthase (glutamine-hydrolyzing) n=1 Tax=Aliarcobacter butzleri TaxID=28197 RepID=UPI0024DE3543|nr:asparagine synthase (glutamine-hydrolyzing) [Aliarcobacter butzleri]MDK2046965.1 asparagine synthase (glutamine-hydrolyzing) [Aliarcobacter butzleri]